MQSVSLDSASLDIQVADPRPVVFYRAAQPGVGTGGTQFRLQINRSLGSFVVQGVVGESYQIEFSPTLGTTASWQPHATVLMTNSVQNVSGQGTTNANGFFRARRL